MKKVYLETLEAVIKALKDGKVVYEENCPDYSFKLIENIIVAKHEDFFEVGSMVNTGNKPYILEEEPFKIEVGKWYETRGNQKARCFLIADNICHFTIDTYGAFVTNTYGYYLGDKTSIMLDIIGPLEKKHD